MTLNLLTKEQFPSFECMLVYECYVALFEDIITEDVLDLDTGVNECVTCNKGTARELVPNGVFTFSETLLKILITVTVGARTRWV